MLDYWDAKAYPCAVFAESLSVSYVHRAPFVAVIPLDSITTSRLHKTNPALFHHHLRYYFLRSSTFPLPSPSLSCQISFFYDSKPRMTTLDRSIFQPPRHLWCIHIYVKLLRVCLCTHKILTAVVESVCVCFCLCVLVCAAHPGLLCSHSWAQRCACAGPAETARPKRRHC